MSSAQDTPLLHLSDIMHHMSSSPEDERERERSGSATPRGASPEPVSEHDALAIRYRLQEMGLWKPVGADNLSSREKELVDMITRLLDPLPIDPAQLTRQAETITVLSAQRDYVLQQAADDRERWRYERETWDRTAEALLAQKAAAPTRVEETNARERQIHDMEIRSLENRLAEAQRRQSALESELRMLKPLLFIQPYFIPRQDKSKGKAREIPASSSNDFETTTIAGTSTSTMPTASSSKLPHPQSSSHMHALRTSSSSKWWPGAGSRDRSKPHAKTSTKAGTPLAADAYSEHLLLAMRKVGRTRVAEVSGIIAHAEKVNRRFAARETRRGERQQQGAGEGGKGVGRVPLGATTTSARGRSGGADRDDSHDDADDADPTHGRAAPSIPPRTPARSTVVHYGPRTTRDNQLNTPIVFVHHVRSSNNTPGASARVQTPAPTPARWREPLGGGGGGGLDQMQYTPVASHHQQSGPPTPLDSLIDAARSMLSDSAGTRKGKGKAPRARGADTDVEHDGDNDEEEAEEEESQGKRGRGSPVPNHRVSSSSSKRRRLDAAAAIVTAGSGSGAGAKLDRPRSALDVLADQAAAAFDFNEREGEGEGETHSQVQTQRRGPGRPRGSRSASSAKSSTSTSTATTAAAAAPVSASGRPIRQSRKAGLAQQAEIESGRGRGTSRPRGRPRGSAKEIPAISRVIASSVPRAVRSGLALDRVRDQGEVEDEDGEGADEEAESMRESMTTMAARASSIASEVLRHGFADATRLRMGLPAVVQGNSAESATSAVPVRIHGQPPQHIPRNVDDVEMRRVDDDAAAGAIVLSPDLSQSPPSLATAPVSAFVVNPLNLLANPTVNAILRPIQTLSSASSGVMRSSDPERPLLPSPTHPPPPESHLLVDLQRAAAHSPVVAAEVHQVLVGPSSVSRPSDITRGVGAPHPDTEAQAHAALDVITSVIMDSGGGSESESIRADKMDADRTLDAEAEARHNLPRGTARQGELYVPSDPLVPRTSQEQGGDSGHGNSSGSESGIGNGANDGYSHDGDADSGVHDVDAEGEMEVDDPAEDAQM